MHGNIKAYYLSASENFNKNYIRVMKSTNKKEKGKFGSLLGKVLCGLSIISAASCGNCTQPAAECNADASKAVIENIMARRSIRKYKQQPVSRDTMNIILECGINAPNGQNKQSWEVRVVDNAATLDKIKELMSEGREMNVGSCFRNAPVMTFIACDKGYDFSAYDCGLLSQNMMLSATSLGIGSICLGSPVRFIMDSPCKDDILSLLGFSEGYELCLCVGFGYPDETPAAKPRDWNKVKYVD